MVETDMKQKNVGVVLAAGQGKRMGSQVHKQYLMLDGKPLLYYALKAFQESSIDQVVLVVGEGEIPFVRTAIVEQYGLHKVFCIVEGGKERYHSVYEGLRAAGACDYILVHDGARPLITAAIIQAALDGAREHRACIVGMPVKDTIKLADAAGFAAETPDRSCLWQIQTPQAFYYPLLWEAYKRLLANESESYKITDDAMVVELMTEYKVKLIEGSYRNIKVTTPEDLIIAEALLKAPLGNDFQ